MSNQMCRDMCDCEPGMTDRIEELERVDVWRDEGDRRVLVHVAGPFQ